MNQADAFRLLELEAARCVRCERMCERQAVLSPLNGSPNPAAMFIAEAPGRNGGDRTRIPFYGDASGENFATLIASIGLTRADLFITNSILCSPRKASGANDKPTRLEIRNCSDFLRRLIDVISPPVIATLGAVALDALRLIEPHQYQLKNDVAQILNWNGRRLIPLYHPSPRVINAARSMPRQLADYQAVRQAVVQSRRK